MLLDSITQQSKLFKLHPLYKCGLFVVFALLFQLNSSLLFAVFLCLVINLLSVNLNALPIQWHIKLLLLSIFALLFSVIPILLFSVSKTQHGVDTLALYGDYRLPMSKIIGAGALLLRSFGMFSALLFFALSTPIHQLLYLMKKMRMPASILELVNLIYRNVFIMLALARDIWLSQQARLGYLTWSVSVRSFAQLLVSVLLLSIKRGEDQYNSLNARCYRGGWQELPAQYEMFGKFGTLASGIAISCSLVLWLSKTYNWL